MRLLAPPARLTCADALSEKRLLEVGVDFGDHQNLSPAEKRKLIAINQLAAMEDRSFVG